MLPFDIPLPTRYHETNLAKKFVPQKDYQFEENVKTKYVNDAAAFTLCWLQYEM